MTSLMLASTAPNMYLYGTLFNENQKAWPKWIIPNKSISNIKQAWNNILAILPTAWSRLKKSTWKSIQIRIQKSRQILPLIWCKGEECSLGPCHTHPSDLICQLSMSVELWIGVGMPGKSCCGHEVWERSRETVLGSILLLGSTKPNYESHKHKDFNIHNLFGPGTVPKRRLKTFDPQCL